MATIAGLVFGVAAPTRSQIRATQRHIRWLEDAGHLTTEVKARLHSNGNATNLYRLHPVPRGLSPSTGEVVQSTVAEVVEVTTGEMVVATTGEMVDLTAGEVVTATRETPIQTPIEISQGTPMGTAFDELCQEDFFLNLREGFLQEDGEGQPATLRRRELYSTLTRLRDQKDSLGEKDLETLRTAETLRDLLRAVLEESSSWQSLDRPAKDRLVQEAGKSLTSRKVHRYTTAPKLFQGTELHHVLYGYLFGDKYELLRPDNYEPPGPEIHSVLDELTAEDRNELLRLVQLSSDATWNGKREFFFSISSIIRPAVETSTWAQLPSDEKDDRLRSAWRELGEEAKRLTEAAIGSGQSYMEMNAMVGWAIQPFLAQASLS